MEEIPTIKSENEEKIKPPTQDQNFSEPKIEEEIKVEAPQTPEKKKPEPPTMNSNSKKIKKPISPSKNASSYPKHSTSFV